MGNYRKERHGVRMSSSDTMYICMFRKNLNSVRLIYSKTE